MPFTSTRERRLWLSALLLQLAIYASLPLVRVPTEWLRERNLLRLTVGLLFLLATVWIGRRIARRRPGRTQLAVLVLFAALYIAMLAAIDRVEERIHFLEYGVVGGLIYAALWERRGHLLAARGSPGPLTRLPAALAILLTALLGWADEGIQALLPSRVYELRDAGLNLAAGLLAISAMAALRWAEARDRRRAPVR